jgi:hypothetical protein
MVKLPYEVTGGERFLIRAWVKVTSIDFNLFIDRSFNPGVGAIKWSG